VSKHLGQSPTYDLPRVFRREPTSDTQRARELDEDNAHEPALLCIPRLGFGSLSAWKISGRCRGGMDLFEGGGTSQAQLVQGAPASFVDDLGEGLSFL
jgi:hypothetical protein